MSSIGSEMVRGLVSITGVVEIIGPIRQELLSGIREQSQFEQVPGYT